MTVVLNEAALGILLEAEDGPVGRFVQRTAERVVEEAQRNVRAYFGSAPTLTVDQDIGLQMDGSSAAIGIRDEGSKAQRLAAYQARGSVNWLVDALEAVSE